VSLYSVEEAAAQVAHYRDRCNADVALRVYTSRLIGRQASLVLHGGGNTSVKTVVKDDVGQDVEVLAVKGSGWDLGDIEPEGFPAVRLAPLLALRALPSMTDEAMVNALRTRMLDAAGPNPSVETLLHAFLPHKFIDHSHADAILALVDQPESERLCRERFGKRLGIVPYVMPGFALSKLAAEVYESDPSVEGLLLLQHGLFTFGDSAEQSYQRHLAAVEEAHRYARERRYWSTRRPSMLPPRPDLPAARALSIIRGRLCEGSRRYVLQVRRSSAIDELLDDPKLGELSQIGCATPDHVIRTKRFPLVLRLDPSADDAALTATVSEGLSAYRVEYERYVQRQMSKKAIVVKPLDPDPRVVLVPGLGLVTAGATPSAAAIAGDIYEHTIDVIRDAEAVGTYQALPEEDIFDMEYWSLEQAKLGKQKPKALEGRVVYVTGAARGIGEATARRFAAEGAALYLVDREQAPLERLAKELRARCEALDLADEHAVRQSVEHAVLAYGGLDGVVSNAGIAPQGPIDRASTQALAHSFAINFYAHHWVASSAVAVMRRQGRGGFLLFNASKAAWNPGVDFGPYALPKAALLALMKQYALELGELGIRSNAVNADRIRTGLLDARDIEQRSSARGLSPDAYYRSNLLHREVTAADVAKAFLDLALADSTTGSVVTVDGGNIAASPR
jgi:rhamnose utilization protein RhaD (predicted bifunctional aldolase and dehydrogenase)/NAD(P)-dependent dehydrogenase (short-subunit alcohol dehydrogenase family)